MFAPVGGSKVSVALLAKLLPLIVSVWLLLDAGIELGDTLAIDGAGVAAWTIKSGFPAATQLLAAPVLSTTR